MFKYLLPFCLGASIGYWLFASDNAPLKLNGPKPVEKTVTVTKVVTNPGLPDRYRVFHDAERGVTCYYKEDSNGAGGMAIALSCVPDTQLRPKL